MYWINVSPQIFCTQKSKQKNLMAKTILFYLTRNMKMDHALFENAWLKELFEKALLKELF